jgi:hypothetical protein
MKLSFFIDSAHPAKAKTPSHGGCCSLTDQEEQQLTSHLALRLQHRLRHFLDKQGKCRQYAPQFPPSRQRQVFVSDEAFNDGGRVTFPNLCCQPPFAWYDVLLEKPKNCYCVHAIIASGRVRLSSEELSKQCGLAPAVHHRCIMQLLEQVTRGELGRLLISAPPGSAKSQTASGSSRPSSSRTITRHRS